jgi:hypothetical protein
VARIGDPVRAVDHHGLIRRRADQVRLDADLTPHVGQDACLVRHGTDAQGDLARRGPTGRDAHHRPGLGCRVGQRQRPGVVERTGQHAPAVAVVEDQRDDTAGRQGDGQLDRHLGPGRRAGHGGGSVRAGRAKPRQRDRAVDELPAAQVPPVWRRGEWLEQHLQVGAVVGVTRVADRVEIDQRELVGVGPARAVVVGVVDQVAILVDDGGGRLTRILQVVLVEVDATAGRARVTAEHQAVAILVAADRSRADARVAPIVDGVTIEVDAPRRRTPLEAGVATAIAVAVGLVRVGLIRAVVVHVDHAVEVAIGHRLVEAEPASTTADQHQHQHARRQARPGRGPHRRQTWSR